MHAICTPRLDNTELGACAPHDGVLLPYARVSFPLARRSDIGYSAWNKT